MRRTVAIVMVAAVVGGLAGGSIGLAFDGAADSSGPVAATAAVRFVRVGSREAVDARADLPRDAPGVVVITDTQTESAPTTFFDPSRKQEVGALGSGFVIDARGDIVTNDHVVAAREGHPGRLHGGSDLPGEGRRHGSLERPRRHSRRGSRLGAPPASVRRLVQRRRSAIRSTRSATRSGSTGR